MNEFISNYGPVSQIDPKTRIKKRVAFLVISVILLLSFFGVRTLPSHEPIHTVTASVNGGL